MIALGIAPGLHSVAYSVVATVAAASCPSYLKPIDADVLHAGRGLTPRDAWEIARRCRAHRLVLDIVLDRHPPAVLAFGPPCDPTEDPANVALVRLALRTIGDLLRIPVYDFGTYDLLQAAFTVDDPRAVSAYVRRAVNRAPLSRDKRVLLATAAAVAGAQACAVAEIPRGKV